MNIFFYVLWAIVELENPQFQQKTIGSALPLMRRGTWEAL
jgi:hypothetical protein